MSGFDRKNDNLWKRSQDSSKPVGWQYPQPGSQPPASSSQSTAFNGLSPPKTPSQPGQNGMDVASFRHQRRAGISTGNSQRSRTRLSSRLGLSPLPDSSSRSSLRARPSLRPGSSLLHGLGPRPRSSPHPRSSPRPRSGPRPRSSQRPRSSPQMRPDDSPYSNFKIGGSGKSLSFGAGSGPTESAFAEPFPAASNNNSSMFSPSSGLGTGNNSMFAPSPKVSSQGGASDMPVGQGDDVVKKLDFGTPSSASKYKKQLAAGVFLGDHDPSMLGGRTDYPWLMGPVDQLVKDNSLRTAKGEQKTRQFTKDFEDMSKHMQSEQGRGMAIHSFPIQTPPHRLTTSDQQLSALSSKQRQSKSSESTSSSGDSRPTKFEMRPSGFGKKGSASKMSSKSNPFSFTSSQSSNMPSRSLNGFSNTSSFAAESPERKKKSQDPAKLVSAFSDQQSPGKFGSTGFPTSGTSAFGSNLKAFGNTGDESNTSAFGTTKRERNNTSAFMMNSDQRGGSSSGYGSNLPNEGPKKERSDHRNRNSKNRTQCFHYVNGTCSKGNECDFSHDATAPVPSAICPFYQQGKCVKGNSCMRRHEGPKDICTYYQNGNCKYGDDCSRKHVDGPNGGSSNDNSSFPDGYTFGSPPKKRMDRSNANEKLYTSPHRRNVSPNRMIHMNKTTNRWRGFGGHDMDNPAGKPPLVPNGSPRKMMSRISPARKKSHRFQSGMHRGNGIYSGNDNKSDSDNDDVFDDPAAIAKREVRFGKMSAPSRNGRGRGAQSTSSSSKSEQVYKDEKEFDIDGPALVGLCPTMCSLDEMEKRVRGSDISMFEMSPMKKGEVDRNRVVKKYARAAAGEKQESPLTVRPPKVLLKTIYFLLMDVLQSNRRTLCERYKFIRDRLRAVQKDLTIQHQTGPEAVEILEKSARFHILAAHELCHESMADFSPVQNYALLSNILTSLVHIYDDNADMKNSQEFKNESEFRAYHLFLLNVQTKTLNANKVPPRLRSRPEIKLVMELGSVMKLNNYVRFFSLLTKKASFFLACLVHPLFYRVRKKAVIIISKTLHKTQPFPIPHLCKILGFVQEDEARKWCNLMDAKVQDDAIVQKTQLVTPDAPQFPKAQSPIVTRLLRGKSYSEIVLGEKPSYVSVDIINEFIDEQKHINPNAGELRPISPDVPRIRPGSEPVGNIFNTSLPSTAPPPLSMSLVDSTSSGQPSQPNMQLAFSPSTSYGPTPRNLMKEQQYRRRLLDMQAATAKPKEIVDKKAKDATDNEPNCEADMIPEQMARQPPTEQSEAKQPAVPKQPMLPRQPPEVKQSAVPKQLVAPKQPPVSKQPPISTKSSKTTTRNQEILAALVEKQRIDTERERQRLAEMQAQLKREQEEVRIEKEREDRCEDFIEKKRITRMQRCVHAWKQFCLKRKNAEIEAERFHRIRKCRKPFKKWLELSQEKRLEQEIREKFYESLRTPVNNRCHVTPQGFLPLDEKLEMLCADSVIYDSPWSSPLNPNYRLFKQDPFDIANIVCRCLKQRNLGYYKNLGDDHVRDLTKAEGLIEVIRNSTTHLFFTLLIACPEQSSYRSTWLTNKFLPCKEPENFGGRKNLDEASEDIEVQTAESFVSSYVQEDVKNNCNLHVVVKKLIRTDNNLKGLQGVIFLCSEMVKSNPTKTDWENFVTHLREDAIRLKTMADAIHENSNTPLLVLIPVLGTKTGKEERRFIDTAKEELGIDDLPEKTISMTKTRCMYIDIDTEIPIGDNELRNDVGLIAKHSSKYPVIHKVRLGESLTQYLLPVLSSSKFERSHPNLFIDGYNEALENVIKRSLNGMADIAWPPMTEGCSCIPPVGWNSDESKHKLQDVLTACRLPALDLPTSFSRSADETYWFNYMNSVYKITASRNIFDMPGRDLKQIFEEGQKVLQTTNCSRLSRWHSAVQILIRHCLRRLRGSIYSRLDLTLIGGRDIVDTDKLDTVHRQRLEDDFVSPSQQSQSTSSTADSSKSAALSTTLRDGTSSPLPELFSECSDSTQIIRKGRALDITEALKEMKNKRQKLESVTLRGSKRYLEAAEADQAGLDELEDDVKLLQIFLDCGDMDYNNDNDACGAGGGGNVHSDAAGDLERGGGGENTDFPARGKRKAPLHFQEFDVDDTPPQKRERV